jgi:DNA-directed RNA polymerase subunit RPC12/RpoP
MALVKAKCTECGAPIEVNPNAKVLVCRYCGSEFIVQDAINNININSENMAINQNFSGANVVINNNVTATQKAKTVKLIINRVSNITMSVWALEVVIDGESCGMINNGESSLIKLESGDHYIVIKADSKCMLKPYSKNITVEENQTVYIDLKIKTKMLISNYIEEVRFLIE